MTPDRAEPSDAPNPLALLAALRRRWPPALAAGLALGVPAAVGVYAAQSPPKHAARAQLYVHSTQPKILFDVKEQRTEFRTYLATQAALLGSIDVVQIALRDDRVTKLDCVKQQPDPVAWLQKEVKVAEGRSAEIMNVSVAAERPEDAQALTAAVVDAYLVHVVARDQKARHDRLEELRKLWEEGQTKLAKKRDAVRKLAERVGPADKEVIALRVRDNHQEYGKLQGELLEKQAQLRHMQAELQDLRTRDPSKLEVTEAQWAALYAEDAVLRQLRADKEAAELLRDQTAASARLGAADPLAVRRQSQVAALDRQIAARERQVRDSARGRLVDQARRTHADRVAELERQIALANRVADAAREARDRLAEAMKAFNTEAVDLQTEQNEIGNQEKVVGSLREEIERLEIEIKAPPRIRQLQQAQVDRSDSSLRRVQTAGFAGLAGLAAGVFGIAYLEFRSRRIDSAGQVALGLGLRVIGELPARGRGAATAEAVDAARTVFLHAARADNLKAVLVTSAVGGEGKTTLAVELAGSLARAGHNTLLIDADLRTGTANQLLELPSGPGVAELLRREANFADCVQITGVARLCLVAAGIGDEEALRALARDGLKPVVGPARRAFDFVVIDAPAVLPTADALMAAPHADGVILAVRHGVSQMHRAQEAAGRLEALGVRLVGAVVVGATDVVAARPARRLAEAA